MRISIIFGTYNRLSYLEKCVYAIRNKMLVDTTYEIIVADPGSTDGSIAWLEEHGIPRVQDKLEGAVPAFNQAYAQTVGEHIALLNDDVEQLTAAALDTACARLEADPTAGQLAFGFTRTGQIGDAKVEYSHINKPYANLGLIKRHVAEKVIKITGGLWSPVYRTYGADTELSCWVHRLGYKVLSARDLVFHDKVCVDELRKLNYGPNRTTCDKDGKMFWGRWPSPKMLEPFGPYPNVTEPELEALKDYEAKRKAAHA